MLLKIPGSKDLFMKQSLLVLVPKEQQKKKKIIIYGQIIKVRILLNCTLNSVSTAVAIHKKITHKTCRF